MDIDAIYAFEGMQIKEIPGKFEKSLKFIAKFKDDISKIFESHEAFEKIAFMHAVARSSYKSRIKSIYNLYKKHDTVSIIVQILSYIIDKHIDFIDLDRGYVRPQPSNIFFYYTNKNLEEKCVYILCYLLPCLSSVLPMSNEFRETMNEKEHLAPLIHLLKKELFMEKFSKHFNDYFSIFIFSLKWTSRAADSHKSSWHELKTMETLFKYAKKFDKYELYFYMIAANIARDKDIENYGDISLARDRFVKHIVTCVDTLGETVCEQLFIDDDDPEKKAHSFSVSYVLDKVTNAIVSLTGLLLALYRFSVNAKIKWSLYQRPGLKDVLNRVVHEGSDIEKQLALQLLAQLAFDERVNADLRKDRDLCDDVRVLAEDDSLPFVKLKRTSELFVWILEQKSFFSPPQQCVDSSIQENPQGYIMISYDGVTSRDLCIKIKKSLEDFKYKIWIDEEEILGSSGKNKQFSKKKN
jgi:hypothetical protein